MNAWKNGCGLILLCLVTVMAGCNAQRSSEPIPIGVLAPRSGPGQAQGEMTWQGVRLAQMEVQDASLIHGRSLVLRQGDTAAGPESVHAIASRLVEVDRVAALLGGPDIHGTEGLGAVAAEGQVPLVVPVGLPGPTNAFVIHTAAAPADRSKALARFALEQKVRRAMVLTATDKKAETGVTAPFTEGFQQAFQAGGGVAAVHVYSDAAELKKLVASDQEADALVLLGPRTDLAGLSARNSKLKRLVLWAGADAETLSLPHQLPAGPVYLSTSFWLDASAAPVKDFRDRFRAQFKQDPDVTAAIAYDDARLLFEGMRRAERFEPAPVRDSLEGLSNFASLTGPVAIHNGWARRTVFVVRLDHGKATLAKAYPPAP